MSRSQTESIRGFILDCVAESPRSVARQVAQAYGISRQAANRHLDGLVDDGVLEQDGFTRSKVYRLRRESLLNREIRVTPVLDPERLWDDHIAPVLVNDRAPVRDLCRGAFGEVIRNVMAHAHASWITVSFEMTARHIEVSVEDDGHGLFNRIAERTGTPGAKESAEAILRDANERSTLTPASRLLLLGRNFDSFSISSSGLSLAYYAAVDRWELSNSGTLAKGTRISMKLRRAGTLRGAAKVPHTTG
jgi:hypothetical protein